MPNGVVRKGAYIAKNVVLMPSFVNIGAYVDQGSMIDTWASVGSCAQVGKNCHISGGAGIGGVLEPMQANPTIIEDNCFVGARAAIAQGVRRCICACISFLCVLLYHFTAVATTLSIELCVGSHSKISVALVMSATR